MKKEVVVLPWSQVPSCHWGSLGSATHTHTHTPTPHTTHTHTHTHTHTNPHTVPPNSGNHRPGLGAFHTGAIILKIYTWGRGIMTIGVGRNTRTVMVSAINV